MRQRLNGAFIQFPRNGGANAFDEVIATVTPYAAARSAGTTCYIPVTSSGPQINQKWSLLNVSFSAGLAYVIGGAANGSASQGPATYGQFGKITCGILSLDVPFSVYSNQGILLGALPWIPPPADTSLMTDLWNPADDDMPPTIPGPNATYGQPQPNQLLSVSATVSPPESLDMIPGVRLAVGISLNPSLFGWNRGGVSFGDVIFGLELFNAQYTVNYDDGS